MIPAVNHVVLSGVVGEKPSSVRGSSGDVLVLAVRTASGDVRVEIRDPFLASLVFKDATAGSQVFLTGSLAAEASGLVVAVEGGRGHDVRILGGVELEKAEVPSSVSVAKSLEAPATPPVVSQEHVPAAVPPAPPKQEPAVVRAEPTQPSKPAGPAERPTTTAAVSPQPSSPPATTPGFPPRPSVAGPGFRPGFSPGGARPGAARPAVPSTPAPAAPAASEAPPPPRKTGIGALGALKSAAKPLSETEPDLEDPTGEETGAPGSQPSIRSLPTRTPAQGGRFSQPSRFGQSPQGASPSRSQDSGQSRQRVEVDPFETISVEAEEIPF